MKINYYSLGCKVNLYESVAIVNMFVDEGFENVPFGEEADVTIINTCTVTATSDSKSRKIIRQARKASPLGIIAVMGCYSQLHEEEIKSLAKADIIIGTTRRSELYEKIKIALNNKSNLPIIKIDNFSSCSYPLTYEELHVNHYDDKTRGFVKIQDGCENYCSYCAIPYSRGPFRSRAHDNIISEITNLVNNGMKEIVLSGINTGAYGKDLIDYDFPDLLLDIVKSAPNLVRIRISSIEVTEISNKLLNVMRENSRFFCDHLHIPLQSGKDETLKRMKRKYDLAHYQSKLEEIRSIFPLINITTDYMVGFSGETDEDFVQSLDNVEKMNFGEMHIFPYSPRPNTLAYLYKNRVKEEEKKQRVDAFLNLNTKKAIEYRNLFLHKTVSVLVEKIENNVAFGHSSNYIEVEFPASNILCNMIYDVEIIEVGYPISKGKKKDE